MSDTFDPLHMIDMREGRLTGTQGDLIGAFAAAAESGGPLVLHFHGGLVSGKAAREAANLGAPFYELAGAYAIFPIWHVGLLEVFQASWARIASESLFKVLVDRVAGWAHGQVMNAIGARGVPSRSLPRVTVAQMMQSGDGAGDFSDAFLGIRPENLRHPDVELVEMEERSIESALQGDAEFKAEWDAVLRGSGRSLEEGARDLGGVPEMPAQPTVADEEVLDRLRQDGNTRGLGLTAAKLVVGIVASVLRRFAKGSDHGLHATTVEEVLRGVYLGAAGTAVWASMKSYTAGAFGNDPMSGGTAIASAIGRLPQDKRVVLLGHSAGAIFICELLNALAPIGHKVEVIFLAPAARCDLFETGLVRNAPVTLTMKGGNPAFRMFTMLDEYETRDTLVRDVPGLGDLTWFYPRSLLYFISGLLEGRDVDADVVGLARTHDTSAWYADRASVKIARDWIQQPAERVSWSVSSAVDLRLRTNSIRHGGFGTPGAGNQTMESVAQIVRSNWW